jgi:hypothetical protein
MSKSAGGHMPRAASRLDAELMSKHPQRQSDSLAALDRRLRQIKCRPLIDC